MHRGLSNPRATIFVLGNAYGVMKYQEPLARRLSGLGYQAIWSGLPGQEGAPGTFSLSDGLAFIEDMTRTLEGQSYGFVAHCASAFGVLALAAQQRLATQCKAIAIYGPLINLQKRKRAALSRLEASGVKFSLPSEVWLLSVDSLLEQCNVPVLLAHSRDRTNARRATPSDVENLSKYECVRRVMIFDHGYDEDIAGLDQYSCAYGEFFTVAFG